MPNAFSRTQMLIGTEGLKKLQNSKIAVFGIGGVGTFAVEGLARCGVGHMTLIDNDVICVSNINRQIHATFRTIGRPKVDVMKDRILEINPSIEVETHMELYSSESAERLLSDDCSYV